MTRKGWADDRNATQHPEYQACVSIMPSRSLETGLRVKNPC